MEHKNTQNDFTPWHKDYKYSMVFSGITAFILVIGASVNHPFISVFIASFTLTKGIKLWRKGKSREFGVWVENTAIHSLQKSLPNGWALTRNISAGHIGNIDIMITLPDQTRYVIESKRPSVPST